MLRTTALADIATGLVRTAGEGDHDWTQEAWRRYTRLLATPEYDAWLIEWSPASQLEPHDHGGSQGVVSVATGKLVERYTDLRGRDPVRVRTIMEGQVAAIPASRVHQVSNPGPTGALSVHVYSPPLRSMTFFDDGSLAPFEEAAT